MRKSGQLRFSEWRHPFLRRAGKFVTVPIFCAMEIRNCPDFLTRKPK